mmetsp:Transcript_75638/g.87960  ORF Transcript_75638/g.87960 Transcript_75638/m.87960 type:complete len:348 (-) Transcript_75638:293-1336(-)
MSASTFRPVTMENMDALFWELVSTTNPKTLFDVKEFTNSTMEYSIEAALRNENLTKKMVTYIENTRLAYNRLIDERDAKYEQLMEAENRLAEVQRIVQRYTVVMDPVVASDGFTYERSVIQQYLEECSMTNTSAYSQQTKEVLQDVLIPNQSLKKLVDLLRTVKPMDIPRLTERTHIPPFVKGYPFYNDDAELEAALQSAAEEKKKKKSAIHASDLEAAFAKPAEEGAKESNRKSNDRTSRPSTAAAAQPSEKASSTTAVSARAAKDKESTKSSSAASGVKLHPCIRVYGFCNFKDDCSFARYPYDACLNNIKGKCRFGNNCKELHVNPSDPKYQNPRNASARKRDD